MAVFQKIHRKLPVEQNSTSSLSRVFYTNIFTLLFGAWPADSKWQLFTDDHMGGHVAMSLEVLTKRQSLHSRAQVGVGDTWDSWCGKIVLLAAARSDPSSDGGVNGSFINVTNEGSLMSGKYDK